MDALGLQLAIDRRIDRVLEELDAINRARVDLYINQRLRITDERPGFARLELRHQKGIAVLSCLESLRRELAPAALGSDGDAA